MAIPQCSEVYTERVFMLLVLDQLIVYYIRAVLMHVSLVEIIKTTSLSCSTLLLDVNNEV
jgi:hypothetical protein